MVVCGILNGLQLVTGPSADCGLQWLVFKEPAGRHCGEAHHAGAVTATVTVAAAAVAQWPMVPCGAKVLDNMSLSLRDLHPGHRTVLEVPTRNKH